MRLIILAILLLMSSSGQVIHALSLSDRDIPSLFADSDVVVNARVVGTHGQCIDDSCITTFNIETISNEKGSLERTATICAYPQLKLGELYTLFMHQSRSEYDRKVLCKYSVWHDGAFRKLEHRAYRYGSPEASIMIEEDGKLYSTDAVMFNNLNEELEVIKTKSK